MVKNSPHSSAAVRKGAPLWAQILIWVGLIVILIFLVLGLFKAQHPILKVGSKVPNFTLQLFASYPYGNASEVRLSDLNGKVVLVNFWASWCVTCAGEAPYVEAAWQHYQAGGKVVFLGVDYTDVDSKALAYLKSFNITYPNGPDLGTRITPIFNRNIAMPETYIIDQRGILQNEQIGPFQSAEEIQTVIDRLLAGE
jgi:cytochrome c biogenesis protein CcmG/thiol:disulfide interchange protein DsbE